jgi:carboxymethylenebutenolidase
MAQTAQAIRGEWVEIDVAGSPMQSYLAVPKQGQPGQTFPAIIVFMEIFGVNGHIRDVAERLAAEGYVAIAPNYYHRTTPNLELGYDETGMTEGRRHKEATTRDGLLVDIRAVIEFLKDLPEVADPDRIGCIGFCFGGHVAYIDA